MLSEKLVCVADLRRAAVSAVVALGSVGMVEHVWATDLPRFDDVTLIVSSSPGGGTDIVARLLGDTMGPHLPGKPNTIYRHMPAAGGIASLNYFYSQAKPDGRTYYIGAGNQLNPVNLKSNKIKYDPKQLKIIGAFVNPSSFLVLRTDAKDRLMTPGAQAVHMAALDGTRSGTQIAIWGAEVLKWNMRLIFGYRGTSAMSLAFQRGEVDMMTNNNIDIIKPLVDRGEAFFVTQTGMLSKGKVVPSGIFPDVPIFASLVEGKVEGRAKAAFALWQQSAQIGKWFALPPDTPDAVVKVYREAFDKAASEPRFREIVSKRVSPDHKEMSIADMEAIVADMVNATDDALKFLSDMREKYRKR
jgi:tripartite-type tricarboxylate transporter receptor subunit TctC